MYKLLGALTLSILLTGCGDQCGGKIEAFVMSQKAVRNNLKSPTTASFPSIADKDVAVFGDVDAKGIDVCKYTVLGYVDAQNSFGGIVRSKYVAELEYTVNTEKWRAVNVTIK